MKGKRRPRLGLPPRLRNLLDRFFPERHLHFRAEGRIAYACLGQGSQVALVGLAAAVSAWIAFTSVSYVLHDQVMATKESQITGARLAYQSVLMQMAEYRRKFAAITHDLEANHDLMLGLVEQNTALQQNLKAVETQLESTQRDREQVIAVREDLKRRLTDVQDRMRGLANRNVGLRDNLDTIESDLQTVLAERKQAQTNSSAMRQRIKELEDRLASLQDSQRDVVQRLTEHTLTNIDGIEKVVEMTGLDINRLLEAGKRRQGQGGPFIDASIVSPPAGELTARLNQLDTYLDHWQTLQGLMRKMPLTVPLNSFHVSSPYGKRRDPVNNKWAMHYGLDLSGAVNTPVFATASGVVVYVGWHNTYGRMVEIDHGAGFKTRYAHLAQISVKKGQNVAFRESIGLLGNSGRSTGSHLHYEILYKDGPKNPLNFIRAGRHVFQE